MRYCCAALVFCKVLKWQFLAVHSLFYRSLSISITMAFLTLWLHNTDFQANFHFKQHNEETTTLESSVFLAHIFISPDFLDAKSVTLPRNLNQSPQAFDPAKTIGTSSLPRPFNKNLLDPQKQRMSWASSRFNNIQVSVVFLCFYLFLCSEN